MMLINRAISTSAVNCLRRVKPYPALPSNWPEDAPNHPVPLPRLRESPNDPDKARSANDRLVGSHLKNRNPMNLERMGIGFKPGGYSLELKSRRYWNKLDLKISNQHTTATVTHWTGRRVCSASTEEKSIAKFLYNYTDKAAVEVVAEVIGQRCLETGLYEVHLELDEEELKKDKMKKFVAAIKASGLIIGECDQYRQSKPLKNTLRFSKRAKPWQFVEQS